MKKVTVNDMLLTDRKWKEFYIGGEDGVFNVSGTTTTKPIALVLGGETPRITCSATNNALDSFYKNKPTEKGGVLTVDSATVGYVSYQNFDFIATDHVEKISSKDIVLNRYIGQFIVNCINNSVSNKYGYGYKFSQKRIVRQKIMLPVNEEGKPDYGFMENYVKEQEQVKLQEYIAYAELVATELEYVEVVSLDKKEWKEFFIVDVFPYIQRGKRLTKASQVSGNKPYISSTSMNNGIDNFIANIDKIRMFSHCLSLANSGSVGSSFYHDYEFIASDHITHLRNNDFSKFTYLFIATITNRMSEKYNFNREINDNRISRDKIILPINDEGEIDCVYMEQYMKNIMLKKYNEYLSYVCNVTPDRKCK